MRTQAKRATTRTPLHALAAALSVLAFACGGGGGGAPEVGGPQTCAECHVQQVAAWENFSSHRALFDCAFCHAEQTHRPGPGHRSVPACLECHSEASHPLAAGGGAAESAGGGTAPGTDRPATPIAAQDTGGPPCARCHDPHGSTNARLIRERIQVGPTEEASIDFTSFLGRADASYAELSAADGGTNGREAGSGLCEVCHTHTRVYDRSGIGPGTRHPTERCTLCHDHAQGFAAAGFGGAE